MGLLRSSENRLWGCYQEDYGTLTKPYKPNPLNVGCHESQTPSLPSAMQGRTEYFKVST